jgi:CPA2 family monovalent cation:H+ antiporter-2
MGIWPLLLDILILLAAAIVLGGLCERFRLSPLLGYLLAGVLLGPNVLSLVPGRETVRAIAELGVALLLFTIGLQFSWRRLRDVGAVALGGGTLQVVLTTTITTGICLFVGFDLGRSVSFGAVIALSSTAAVLQLLTTRAEVDSVHGRYALGILLLQDIAVVPLVLAVAVLSAGGTTAEIVWDIIQAIAVATALVAALYVLLNFGLPVLLGVRTAERYSDLPVLLAVVAALGATWLSYQLGFSPVLGAFCAGMLLAESPFAIQVRADIVPFRTLFVTLFFCSIGMLSNPGWFAERWPLLLGVVALILIGKSAVTTGAVRVFGVPAGLSLATGIVLAQMGEFSLVIALLARQGGLIGPGDFDLIVAAMVTTLFLTPFLVGFGPKMAQAVGHGTIVSPSIAEGTRRSPSVATFSDHLVLVGFGPAGQRTAELLMGYGRDILVVELARRTADLAIDYGLRAFIGDATRAEVLDQLHLQAAACVVVTIPDPWSARHIIQLVRALAPDTPVVVRSRYHIHRWQLELAGADLVVDEEAEVGVRIAEGVRQQTSTRMSVI